MASASNNAGKLSNKVLGMKFMQRKIESEKKLEEERQREQSRVQSQWTTSSSGRKVFVDSSLKGDGESAAVQSVNGRRSFKAFNPKLESTTAELAARLAAQARKEQGLPPTLDNKTEEEAEVSAQEMASTMMAGKKRGFTGISANSVPKHGKRKHKKNRTEKGFGAVQI